MNTVLSANLLRRRQVNRTGHAILFCVTLLSVVSSYAIYSQGFADFSRVAQRVITIAAISTVEGCFLWLLWGFSVAFSSASERAVALIGMVFFAGAMITNIVTHFMQVKGFQLSEFQNGWIQWGAISVIGMTLTIVLCIQLLDQAARAQRQELRLDGKAHDTAFQAREAALESDTVVAAALQVAQIEADKFSRRLIGAAASADSQGNRVRVGFQGEDELNKSTRAFIEARIQEAIESQSK